MSIPLENLRRDLRTRLENDPMMSQAWVVLPLLWVLSIIIVIAVVIALVVSYVTSLTPGTAVTGADFLTMSGILPVIAAFSVIAFALNILLAWMEYKLIRRRNMHFGRQIFFYEDIKSALAEMGTKKGADLSIQLSNIERTTREARLYETEKNPILWVALALSSTSLPTAAILSSTGSTTAAGGLLSIIATLYIYYFLMKDFYRHERREDQFVNEVIRGFSLSGLNVSLPYRNPPMPERSLALYVVLSIVTLGFFWIYWVHVLLNDPNNHFRQQMLIEDTIMAQLSGASTSPPLPSPASI